MASLRFKDKLGNWHRIPARGPKGERGDTGNQGVPGPNLIDEQTLTSVEGLLMGDAGTVRPATPGVDYAAADSAVEMRLLWTNPSPTSAFAPQTIALDLAGYDAVLVVFRSWMTRDIRSQLLLHFGLSCHACCADTVFCWRTVSWTGEGIVIGRLWWAPTYNASPTERTQNDGGIPVEVYGIKGLRGVAV